MKFETKTSSFEPNGVKNAFKLIKAIDFELCFFFRFIRENGEAHGETRMTFPQIQRLLEHLGGEGTSHARSTLEHPCRSVSMMKASCGTKFVG